MNELDIYRSANLLIEKHGEDAGLVAARRAFQLQNEGNTEGEAVWVSVLKAILDLRKETPEGPVH